MEMRMEHLRRRVDVRQTYVGLCLFVCLSALSAGALRAADGLPQKVLAVREWARQPALAQTGYAGRLTLDPSGIEFRIRAYLPHWKLVEALGMPTNEVREVSLWLGGGAPATGSAEFAEAPEGGISARWSLKSAADVKLERLFIAVGRFPEDVCKGGTYVIDDVEKAIPKEGDDVFLFGAKRGARKLALKDRDGKVRLALAFPAPTDVMFQDNARYGGALELQLIAPNKSLVAGQTVSWALTVDGPLKLKAGKPLVLAAGDDWLPLSSCRGIVPGSALDFSRVSGIDAPAGKYGRVVARNGHFEFANRPGVPQRFYGANLCFGANYPQTPEAAEAFASEFARRGYNAVRIHHHDGLLVEGQKDSVTLNPVRMRELDALAAAFVRHGVYMTTDLYVSRPVPWRDLGESKPGNVVGAFKMLVRENDKAFSNLCAFAENWLTHVNPFTGRRWVDEPALAWISLVNENAADNYIKMDAAELERQRDLECRFYARMSRFLRERLGAKQLLTDLNGFLNGYKSKDIWNVCRQSFDYVDMHFYVDHPYFLGRPWALPTECSNRVPFDDSGLRVVPNASYCRIPGKPFTITEWNFSAPGRYRGVGGIATGAWAARENWDALWCFAWSHSTEGVMNPCGQRMGSFDLSGDPIARASERASLCLFLRGDLKPGQADALKLDGRRGQMEVVTERTAGGFAKRGKIKAGIFTADVGETPTTVWASALDDRPLTTSRRILVTHLTDVQNTGARFGDESMKVSLADGDLPHLMRRGRADVSLKLRPGAFAVYVLNEDGARRGKIAARQTGGRLSFVADVGRDKGAVSYLYEIVRLKERQKTN